MNEIVIRGKSGPEAFVMKYLVMNYGFNFRAKVSYYNKSANIWRIPVQLVLPQYCKCCGQPKPADLHDAGQVKVKKNAEGEYEIIADEIKIKLKQSRKN